MFKLSLVQYLSIYLVITFHYALYFTTLAEYPLCTHLAPLYCWMCLRSGVVPSKLVKVVAPLLINPAQVRLSYLIRTWNLLALQTD